MVAAQMGGLVPGLGLLQPPQQLSVLDLFHLLYTSCALPWPSHGAGIQSVAVASGYHNMTCHSQGLRIRTASCCDGSAYDQLSGPVS